MTKQEMEQLADMIVERITQQTCFNFIDPSKLIAELKQGEKLMCSFNGNTVEATPWEYAEGKYSVVVKRGKPGVEDRTFTNDPSVAVNNFLMLCRVKKEV